jgi:hypothetical protein
VAVAVHQAESVVRIIERETESFEHRIGSIVFALRLGVIHGLD